MKPDQAIELKNQLVSQGLSLHRDFEWQYRPAQWCEHSEQGVDARSVIFVFQDPTLATFYRLRWSHHN